MTIFIQKSNITLVIFPKPCNIIMLGRGGIYTEECVAGGYIGADFGIREDLANNLPDIFKAFNAYYIPIFLAAHPDKKKVGAGLACGMLWTICRGLEINDVVISPDDNGEYRVLRIIPREPKSGSSNNSLLCYKHSPTSLFQSICKHTKNAQKGCMNTTFFESFNSNVADFVKWRFPIAALL